MIDFQKLRAPFPPDRISWRVGSTTGDKKRGMALAYIDARDVMERLDAVCGPAGWQCRYPHANGKTVCEIGIKVDAEWVWKSDGAGDTDFEAEKGALSDSYKRAAVRWGIGRYLYDVDAPWVEIEGAGKSFKIKDSELPKLHRLLSKGEPAAPEKPAPAPKAAAPTKGYHLLDPATGEFKVFEKGSEFLAALETGMTSGDPVQWWGANGSTARLIAEKHPQAAAKVKGLETLAIGKAA